MISKSHLVLLFSLIEVTVKHLKDSVLGINLSVVVLLVDLNLLLESFSFGETEPLTPLRQDLHPVQVRQSLLFDHLCLQVVSPETHHLLFLFKVLIGLLLITDTDHLAAGLLPHYLAFDKLAELGHTSLF